MNQVIKKVGITIFLLFFTVSLQAQAAGEGFEKTFSVIQHDGAPYDFMVTDEVHAGHDFDGDGNMEFFAVADHSNPNSGGQWEQPTGHSVWLYEASGAGDYDLAWSWFDTTLNTGGASFPTATVGDLDGDGNPELLLGMPYGSGKPDSTTSPARFYVWEADDSGLPADGTPTAIWDFGVSPGTNTRPSCIAVDDIDGDGAQEVALGFRAFSDAVANDAMMVFSLNGEFAGDFTQWTTEVLDTTSDVGSTYAAAITDVDNDGNKEAFFSTDYGSWFEASGADTYVAYPEHLKNTTNSWWTIQAVSNGDVDNDGVPELWFGKTNGDICFMEGVADLATADSTDVTRVMNLAPTGIRGMAVGQYHPNIAGYGDVIVGGNYGTTVHRAWLYSSGTDIADSTHWGSSLVYLHDETGAARTYSVSFGGDQETPGASADLDGNGKPDLVIGFEDGDSTATEYVVVVEGMGGTVAIEKDFGSPVLKSYKLSQNYPNPFNPATTIGYSIGRGGMVQLTVFDLLGRKVQTLVSEHHVPGEYSSQWDGTDVSGEIVASGVYMYRLEVNGAVLSRQMTFIR